MSNLKQQVLNQTNNGFDFFKFIITELELKEVNKCEPTYNPFYNDTKPSLSIYFNDAYERWYFKDFGDESYSGDVFDFAAHHYQLDSKSDFFKILKLMITDLKIEIEDAYSQEIAKVINIFSYKLTYKNGDGIKDAFAYFKQFGISESILKEYRVRAVNCAYSSTTSNEIKTKLFKEKEQYIAYEDIYFAKLYCPNPKNFFYIGNKPKDFVFGINQIFNRAHKAKKFPELLVLTGGEKDVLTLTTLGFDAVSLNSETSSLPCSLYNLLDAYKNILIFYDNDDTGIRNANKIKNLLEQRYNVSICTLPKEIDGKYIKDVSDYMKQDLPISALNQIIKDSINNQIHIPLSDVVTKLDKQFKDNSPILPEWLYGKLPKFLNELLLHFNDSEERDLAFISSLTVLSSCFPKVSGYYGHGKVSANLFFFVSAPASAGKGVMMYSKRLASGIQKHLLAEYKIAFKKYLADYEDYKINSRKNPDVDEPEFPKQKALFIPANTSISKMIQMLGANKNFGIIFESEGDTLSTSLKNDWANYSDILRKAAHHETVSLARKANDEFIEIENPCLSVCLSGTPNQFEALIGGVENGLTSRFLFYELTNVKPWKNQFSVPDSAREVAYQQASDYISKLWQRQTTSEETIVRVPDFVARLHTEFFTEKFDGLRLSHGDDIIASVRRHGLISFRIMMLLAIFRHLEQNEWLPEFLDVTEEDAKIALVITEVLMVHLENVFKRLDGGAVLNKLNSKQRSLFEALPDTFNKKLYIEMSAQKGIKIDAGEKYIRDFIKYGAINRVDQGQYRKVS